MVSADVVREGPGEAVVAVRGDLTGDDWASTLQGSLERPYASRSVDRVTLDLDGVTLIDLTGVATLIALWREAARNGKTLTIAAVREQPTQKLTQTGVLDLLRGSLHDRDQAPASEI